MTLRVNVKSKLSCPKHPRYDPAMQGEGGIRGGCVVCQALLVVHKEAGELRHRIDVVKEDIKAAKA